AVQGASAWPIHPRRRGDRGGLASCASTRTKPSRPQSSHARSLGASNPRRSVGGRARLARPDDRAPPAATLHLTSPPARNFIFHPSLGPCSPNVHQTLAPSSFCPTVCAKRCARVVTHTSRTVMHGHTRAPYGNRILRHAATQLLRERHHFNIRHAQC